MARARLGIGLAKLARQIMRFFPETNYKAELPVLERFGTSETGH